MADISTVRDDIKRRLSLAGYVGREVKLTRKNREFTGLCPFHPEKTPSFSVVEDKGFYHCFGCGANGDVFNWHTDKLGMGFGEALVILAKDAGVTLPERDKQPEQDALAPHRQVMNMA
ncbi:MAG: DNA primase, partial [Alphaproteobacteria bacterium]|nr:DNA primase [Alphaproteobacteria bacterium]